MKKETLKTIQGLNKQKSHVVADAYTQVFPDRNAPSYASDVRTHHATCAQGLEASIITATLHPADGRNAPMMTGLCHTGKEPTVIFERLKANTPEQVAVNALAASCQQAQCSIAGCTLMAQKKEVPDARNRPKNTIRRNTVNG